MCRVGEADESRDYKRRSVGEQLAEAANEGRFAGAARAVDVNAETAAAARRRQRLHAALHEFRAARFEIVARRAMMRRKRCGIGAVRGVVGERHLDGAN